MEQETADSGAKMRDRVYFISDFHFGIPDYPGSLKREKAFIAFLDLIRSNAKEIFLMGDLFDFWFEYRTVVPKGFVRLLGKLAELTDQGIPIHLFRGNHDVWAFSYLKDEAGIQLHREPEERVISGKRFLLLHGDGYGPGDHGYKFIKKVFGLGFNQWLFRWLHPDWGTRMGLYFSRRSRIANEIREGKDENGTDVEQERLYRFCKDYLKTHPGIDFFVLGHRHRPVDVVLDDHARCIILGDWITHFSYAVFDGENIQIQYFKEVLT